MKNQRNLFCWLISVILLFSMSVNVFAENDEKVVLSDVVYDYGLVAFSEESLKLDVNRQKEIFSIPKEIAENLTTETLLETILNNPFILDFLAYDDFSQAINSKDNQFQIKELLSRPNINNIIEEYKNNYKNSVEIYEKELKLSLNQEIVTSSEMIDKTFNVVRYEFLNKLLYYSLSNENNNSFESRITQSYVYTHNYVAVPCILGYTWEDHGMTETSAKAGSALYNTLYPLAGEVAGEDPEYNCHSFAWHMQTTNNNIWIPSPNLYIAEATRVYPGNIQVGDLICYYDSTGKCEHSGYVYSIKSNGTVDKVVSKWGFYDLMMHSISHCPYADSDIRYYRY